MTAAPRIAFPAAEFNLPSSFNVSTVILTDVAVRITPMNTFCNTILVLTFDSIIPGRLKNHAVAKPPANGTNTPITAIIVAAFPHFFNSFTSVSMPAQNIRITTPTSAVCVKNSVCGIILNTAGPSSKPANNAPTTCGIRARLVKSPKNFVHIKINAR